MRALTNPDVEAQSSRHQRNYGWGRALKRGRGARSCANAWCVARAPIKKGEGGASLNGTTGVSIGRDLNPSNHPVTGGLRQAVNLQIFALKDGLLMKRQRHVCITLE